MTGGDDTIIHSAAQTQCPLETSEIVNWAQGLLARGRSKTPSVAFVSKEQLNQFAGHLGGIMGRFS